MKMKLVDSEGRSWLNSGMWKRDQTLHLQLRRDKEKKGKREKKRRKRQRERNKIQKMKNTMVEFSHGYPVYLHIRNPISETNAHSPKARTRTEIRLI